MDGSARFVVDVESDGEALLSLLPRWVDDQGRRCVLIQKCVLYLEACVIVDLVRLGSAAQSGGAVLEGFVRRQGAISSSRSPLASAAVPDRRSCWRGGVVLTPGLT